MPKRELAVIILAAGIGKRMKSDLPKVLHELSGRPLVQWVVRAAKRLMPERIIVVTGRGGEQVRESLNGFNVSFARQAEQLGTAHAVLQAKERLRGFTGDVMVLSGDVPMVTAGTLKRLLDLSRRQECALSFVTAQIEDPTGYGRVLRGSGGEVEAIVEERDATREEKAIKEINGGVYLFDSLFLFETLPGISAANDQKEQYLTDVVKMALERGQKVAALKLADPAEIAGVNSREELEQLNKVVGSRQEYGNCPAS